MCGSVRAIDVQHGNRDHRLQPRRSGGRATKGSCCGTAAAAAPARASAARAARRFRRRCGRRADQKTIRKTFPTLTEARSWRHESQVALRKGTLRSASRLTLQEAADSWLLAAAAGVVTDAYRRGLQALSDPRLPASAQPPRPPHPRHQTADRDQPHDAAGLRRPALSARTVREQRPQHHPAAAGDLPARPPPQRRRHQPHPQTHPPGRPQANRERVAAPTEIAPLLDALQPADRAIYATALYAGLRLGELQALQWDDIDLDQQPDPRHAQGWDRQTGFIAPKSRSGKRRVPITAHPPPRTPHPPPPPRHRRPRLRLPKQKRQQTLQPRHPQTPHQQSLGRQRTSHRSASTNAATPTPPT